MVTYANLTCICQESSNRSRCPQCQSLPVGALVGYRYKIKKIIGKGGFSITYLVEDLDCFNQIKVLKQLRRIFNNKGYDSESNETAKRLFKREAEVLLKLQHPGIPKLYAYFIDDGYSYLIQDFIPGKNLAEEVIERNYSFDEHEARKLLLELADILEYLHTQNPIIIHRDVKPENLMHHTNGQLLLIDFGAVCQWVETTNQTLIYSAGYTAPEQIAGEPVPQSDLYSVGVTALRLLASDSIVSNIKPKEGGWEAFIPVTMEFAAIINDLLIPDLNKRLKSASELKWRLQLLPALPPTVGTHISPTPQYCFRKSYSEDEDPIFSPTLISEEQLNQNTTIELGDLKEIPFLFLLQRILENNLSGSLVCTNKKINKNILFQEGKVISASSTEPIDQMDDLLIRISNITSIAFAEAKKEMSDTYCSFSDALIRLNVLSKNELMELRKLQISQIASSLFTWTNGHYELRCEKTNLNQKFSISVADLIFEGLRNLENSSLLKCWLGDFSRQIVLQPNYLEISKSINLKPEEVFILSRISATTTINEILSLNCLPELEVLKALCGLISVGLIKTTVDQKRFDRSVDSMVKLLKEMRNESKVYSFQQAANFCYEIETLLHNLDNIGYYELLNIRHNATTDEICQAYQKAIKKFHPDVNEELCKYNPPLKQQLEKIVSHILVAYRVLNDVFSRKKYDNSLKLKTQNSKQVKRFG